MARSKSDLMLLIKTNSSQKRKLVVLLNSAMYNSITHNLKYTNLEQINIFFLILIIELYLYCHNLFS